MLAKEPNLHTRLNDLENELKELHERLLKKRNPLIGKTLVNCTKLSNNMVQKKRTTFFPKCIALNEGNMDPYYSLHKNFTHGKDVISKTGSLTDITSLSSGLHKVFGSINKREVCNTYGSHGEKRGIQKKKSKFVYNNKQFDQSIQKTLSDVFEYNIIGHPQKYRVKEAEIEINDHMLNLKLLKERIECVKKKLREERTKREIAERAIIGYRRRLAILEGKTDRQEENEIPETNDKNLAFIDFFASLQKQMQEEGLFNKKSKQEGDDTNKKTLDSLEQELNEERKKRLDAEKIVTELQSSLDEMKNTVIKLEEGKKLAVSMADQFREKATKNDFQEVEKLKSEKAALENELRRIKEVNQVSPDVINKLVERAERAEKELIEKMKQCNDIMAKSSLKDPEVVKLIEKHKKAYALLQAEKKSKETELKNRCNGLLKEVETATFAADKRYEEMSKKYNEAVFNISKKESTIDKLKNENNLMESEQRVLKNKLQEVQNIKEQQECLITSLKDQVKCNEEHLVKVKKEYHDSNMLYVSLELKYKKLHSAIVEQDRTIEKLRKELEQEKDSVKIKDKMLQDQADTIKCLRLVADNTKKTLDEERVLKCQLLEDIDKLEDSQENLHSKIASTEKKLKEAREEKTKEDTFLKQLEYKVRERHKEWQQQIEQVSQEKDKATQAARFASEKLVKAINDYESKLSAQRKIQGVLNSALKEKSYQLHMAKLQVQELNEEVWKSAKITERVRNDLQTKLKKACEVCTDVIDAQVRLDT